MAEYNIQMNRYVSASDSYDQLFPKTKTIDVVDQNGDNLDTLLGEKIDYDEKGAANGVASLGADGKVPSSQLPATGYSKDETLTAATAALFGFPNTAVPDDVFAWLGRYAEHRWKRRSVTFTENQANISGSHVNLIYGSYGDSKTFYYGFSVSPSGDTVKINNKQSVVIANTEQGAQMIAGLAPCYFEDANGIVYYLPEGTTYGSSATYSVFQIASTLSLSYQATPSSIRAKIVSVTDVTYGEWEYVYSPNRNAYPDSGIVDGYEYEYLFRPFDHLTEIHTKIETGSYVGTGTYGGSNPNSLTFSFKPKVLLITSSPNQSSQQDTTFIFYNNSTNSVLFDLSDVGNSYSAFQSYGASLFMKHDNNTLYWYTTSTDSNYAPNYQYNKLNFKYHYFAIG